MLPAWVKVFRFGCFVEKMSGFMENRSGFELYRLIRLCQNEEIETVRDQKRQAAQSVKALAEDENRDQYS